MFNEKLFKMKIKEKGFTLKEIASFLNIDTSTLYRKMNGESDFYRNEIQKLCNLLEFENPVEIFFA